MDTATEGGMPTGTGFEIPDGWYPGPNTWPESVLRAVEVGLAVGHIDRAERLLNSREMRAVVAMGGASAEARVDRVRAWLPEAKRREAIGGPGSLIDHDHDLSRFLAISERIRADQAARKAAAALQTA